MVMMMVMRVHGRARVGGHNGRGSGRDALETRSTQRVRARQELGRVLVLVVRAHACRTREKVVGEIVRVYVYRFD